MSGAASKVFSVWPVAQTPHHGQRAGRYLPASDAHPGRMLPELARQVIAACSAVGDLVVDPMCGIGTTLVEAVHLGRDALGIELEARWATLANRNLAHARTHGATGQAEAIRGDAQRLAAGLLDNHLGRVDLILTSPPYGPSTHGRVRSRAGGIDVADVRYSHNRRNLAQLPQRHGTHGDAFTTALAAILTGCRHLLKPGGRLAITVRPYRRHGQLVDLTTRLIRLATTAGLELDSRYVALLAGLRDSRLVPRASFFQIAHQRTGTIPRMLVIAHEDLLVFRAGASLDLRRKPKSRRVP